MISDFWLGVILTISAEAIITILIVDYLGQKEKDDENEWLLKISSRKTYRGAKRN